MQHTQLKTKIGKRVKDARIQAGLTQEQLAEKTGVSWSTVSSLERGLHMVSIERLLDISESLNSGLEVLLCDFIDLKRLNTDESTKQIMEIWTRLSPKQKDYILECMLLLIKMFPEL